MLHFMESKYDESVVFDSVHEQTNFTHQCKSCGFSTGYPPFIQQHLLSHPPLICYHPAIKHFNYQSFISNSCNFRQKHTGVPDGSDGSDGTSYPLTENYTLPVAQATGRVAYLLLHFVVTFTHHQKDTCVTLFAGAAVLLKPFTQCLAMLNYSYYLSFNDFQNLCIQFVFSSMDLCIFIANMYSPLFSPPPLPLYLHTPAVAH